MEVEGHGSQVAGCPMGEPPGAVGNGFPACDEGIDGVGDHKKFSAVPSQAILTRGVTPGQLKP